MVKLLPLVLCIVTGAQARDLWLAVANGRSTFSKACMIATGDTQKDAENNALDSTNGATMLLKGSLCGALVDLEARRFGGRRKKGGKKKDGRGGNFWADHEELNYVDSNNNHWYCHVHASDDHPSSCFAGGGAPMKREVPFAA